MIINLDMVNSFDRVRRNFLLNILGKMGFGETFIKWKKLCIYSPWISLLVNGRVVGFFKSSGGLPKDDPSPPFYIS